MKNKIISLVISAVIYYAVALLLSFVCKYFGLIDGNIFAYTVSITLGWVVAKILIELFESKRKKQ